MSDVTLTWNKPMTSEQAQQYLLTRGFVAVELYDAEMRRLQQPVDMLLYCPRCNFQHVDKPQPEKNWDNPPHRSHECQKCGHVWRPADVATNGVEKIRTAGHHDKSAKPDCAQCEAVRERDYEIALDLK